MTGRPFSANLSLVLAAAAAFALTTQYAGADEYGHRRYEYPPPAHHAGYYGYGPVSRSDLPGLLAAHGFTRIHDIDKDDGVYEVEARHVNGRKAEIEIDIATGRILEIDWD